MAEDTTEDQATKKASKHGAEHLAKYRWKPGESGNPNGRPKGARSFNDALRRVVNNPANQDAINEAASFLNIPPEQLEGATQLDVLAMTAVVRGIHSKSPAWTKLISDTIGRMVNIQEPPAEFTERERAVAVYQQIIDSKDATIAEKMKARENMDKVLGLVPTDSEAGGADNSAKELLESLRKMRSETTGEEE